MGVWAPLVTAAMSEHVVSVHQTGADVDADYATVDGPVLELAEVLALTLAHHGVTVPSTDARLAAVLARDGVRADPAVLVAGTVVQAVGGRVGFACGRRAVIESAGENLTRIITPEPGRYRSAWFLPGITYMEGAS